MKLSLRGEYALRALMVLGEPDAAGIVRIQAISEAQQIPKRFLEQILNDLKTGGFLESRRGMAGGYRLARPPQTITLAEVLGFIEGTSGRDPSATRLNETQTAIRSALQEASAAAFGILEGISVADLCERAHRLRRERSGGLEFVI